MIFVGDISLSVKWAVQTIRG